MRLPARVADDIIIVREAIAQGSPDEGEYVPGRYSRKRQSLFDYLAG